MKIEKGFGYNKCGIYCITNTINNKYYIGSSNHIYYRVRRHKSDLTRNCHDNSYLQNAYNKYGADSFIVSIIEECEINNKLEREQHYIDLLNPIYNLTKNVINNTLSIESRLKISNTMKAKVKAGIRVNPLNTDKKKEINLYDCKCNFIKKFNGYNEAGRYLNNIYPLFKPNSTSQIIKSKSGKYKDYYLILPHNICKNTITRSDAFIVQITNIITNEINIFKSAIEAAKYLNCSETTILKSIKKPRLTLKKYKLIKL